MNKAIKYRLYPTTEQSVMFAKTFGCCRKVWNLMLADKIDYYKSTGTTLNNTPAQYKKAYPFLKEVDSLALANVQLNLQTAYKNFFKDKKVGFPKYKSAKHSRKSYTTNNQKGSVAICGNTVKLPKVGKVKAVIHRQPNPDWIIKSATVSQDSDGKFYVSVLFEYDAIFSYISKDSNNAIGLDYKSDGLYMDSNVKAALAMEGTDFKRHKDVVAYFNKNYVATEIFEKKLGRMLSNLQQTRETSDYDDFFIASKEDAETQCESAEKIIEAVRKYLMDKYKVEV